MRQETRIINIYTFDELSKEAKNRVRMDMFEYSNHIDEITDSFKAIAKALNCTIKSDSYDGITYRVELINNESEAALELSGSRAIAYVWNNYIEPNGKGKYIGERYRLSSGKYIKCNSEFNPNPNKYKYVQFFSKLQMEYDNCPFTGVCYDYALWNAWKQFINDIRTDQIYTVADFLQILESHMSKMLTDDNEGVLQDDYIEGLCEGNDYEFYEDGTIV